MTDLYAVSVSGFVKYCLAVGVLASPANNGSHRAWLIIWPALAITLQEWLDGRYGEDVNAAMKVLQQRVDTEYERSDNVLRCLAVRREG
jgi:hypothetical protein